MSMIAKSALAAVMLTALAVSANAQQAATRQIQVLAAPGVQAAQPAAEQPKPEIVAQKAEIPAEAPAVEAPAKADAAPKEAPVPAPKFVEEKPAPKFVAPVIEKPVRKAFSHAGPGYGRRAPNCH